MKHLFSVYAIACISLIWACEPYTDSISTGGVVKEEALDITVTATTPGGNEIVMVNHTPGVGSYWNYIVGRAAQDSVKAILPFLGKQAILFTGICDGGTVKTTRYVDITQIDHPADPTWTLFAGTGISGKRWIWDRTVEAVYGDGGWQATYGPDWVPVTADNTDEPNGYFIMDLNGGPNFTKYDAQGHVKQKGTFTFDMTDMMPQTDNGSEWSVGVLTLENATVMSGHLMWDEAPVYKFRILKITEDQLVLCAAKDGAAGWDDATFWFFRSQGEDRP